MRRFTQFAMLVLAVQLCLASPTFAENWPQFRGSDSRGLGTDGAGLPVTWSDTENVAWQTDVPGAGWSSPIVWEDRVFLTTVVNLDDSAEEPKKGLYFGGNREEPPTAEHEWKVFCFDLNSGDLVWEHTAHKDVPESSIHLKNTFASETPVTDGERLYVYFGNLGVFCYDLDGNLLWDHTTGAHKTRYGWGTAASPVVHDERLYIVNDNDEESYLSAFDARTGDEIWRVDRDEKSNWATPYIWENDERTEIVTPGTNRIRSYDLEGNPLWQLGGMSSITIPTPFTEFGYLYVTSGYIMDKKTKPVYAIRPGASGDITLEEEETSSDFIAWANREAGPYNPTPVLYGEQLYVLLDLGFLTAYDAKSGDEVYGKQRLPNGKSFTSSPWAYDGKVFCLNEYGTTFVVEAGPEFEIVHENSLGEDVMCMATPAIVGDRLLIRSADKLYCIRDASSGSQAGR